MESRAKQVWPDFAIGRTLVNAEPSTLMPGLEEVSRGDRNVALILIADADATHQSVVTAMDALRDVAKELETKFGEPKKAALVWRAQNQIAVDDEAGEKILKLLDSLDDNDDVQNVYSNVEFSDALMAKMG